MLEASPQEEKEVTYTYMRLPRDYQIKAMKRAYRVRRILLYMDPGTGKTKVALDFIGVLLLAQKIKRILVVAPLTALGVWEDQIALDAPQIKYSRVRPDIETDWAVPLLLTNYDYFHPRLKKRPSGRQYRDTELLDRLIAWEPDVVILDESHKIKNPYTRSAKAAHKLGRVCTYALCLTGTPKGNKKVLDLWSQFQFLQPGLLDLTFKDFKQRYCIFGGYGGFELKKFRNLPELAGKIRPHIMRQKKMNLPEQIDIPVRVDLDPRAQKLYHQMEKEFIAELSKEKVVTAPIVLAKLTKLSQLAGGFIRTNGGEDVQVHRNKLEALEEIIEDLRAADVERVVIFARFLWEIKQIRELLAKWVCYEISGNIPEAHRKLAVSMFNSGGGAMICQASTGSTALNLQAANYVVFYSVGYSLIDYLQARDRIHRIGQDKTCFYYQLRAKGTIDNRVYRLLEEHRDAAENFMNLVEGIRGEAA